MTNPKFATMLFLAAAALAVIGCTAFAGPKADESVTCTGTADDLVACTVDVCSVTGGAYQHIAQDSACAVGQMCSATAGCIARDPVCPASCDDHVACTVDSCVSGACQNRANDDACPGDATCRASAADGASGCYTAPVEPCSAGCDDHVACTIDSCTGGVCLHFADVTECSASQHCSATAGCVDDTVVPPPVPAARFCADGERIGERIRFSFSHLSGLRSFAGRALTEANAGAILWNFYSTPNTFAPGEVVELAVVGGTINIHLNDGGTIAFDSRMADLQNVSTATHDVTGEDMGITAEVLRAGHWVSLPEGFLYFGHDTHATRWGLSDDPLIPTDALVGRLLQNTDCATQYQVYEGSTYRAAR